MGQMGAREQPQRGRGEADGSETGGMAPDRLNFGAYPNLHPRPCPIAHAQPTSQHSAASTVARCGEGGMVGGWLAGASPSDPLSGLVTNRKSRSRPFAHNLPAPPLHLHLPPPRSPGASKPCEAQCVEPNLLSLHGAHRTQCEQPVWRCIGHYPPLDLSTQRSVSD